MIFIVYYDANSAGISSSSDDVEWDSSFGCAGILSHDTWSSLGIGASAYISLIGLSGNDISLVVMIVLWACSSALAASSSVAKTTKPKPLLLLLSLSYTTLVYVTSPYWVKNSLRWNHLTRLSRFPTNNLFFSSVITSINNW